jgi:hypothetical protein
VTQFADRNRDCCCGRLCSRGDVHIMPPAAL